MRVPFIICLEDYLVFLVYFTQVNTHLLLIYIDIFYSNVDFLQLCIHINDSSFLGYITRRQTALTIARPSRPQDRYLKAYLKEVT